MAQQVFLFLQGPISPFFAELGAALARAGHRVVRVNVNLGDWLFWHAFSGGAGQVYNYRGSPSRWPAYIDILMAREKVTDLILLGEQRVYQLAAIAAAKPRGIAVTATDFGYLRPDWITLEPDGMSGNSRLPRDPRAIRRLAAEAPPPDLEPRFTDDFARQARWDVLYHGAMLLGWVLYPFHRSYHINHPVRNYLGTGWRLLRQSHHARHATAVIDRLFTTGAQYWVLPMQMEVDFSLRAYSPYPDMLMPMREVVASFARAAPQNSKLLIKLHPLDPGLRSWKHVIRTIATDCGVADRVIFIDGGSLDRLLERARGVVTVNSTVGIWSIRAGVPTMTLGEAVYNIAGLVFTGPLDRFWTDAAPPDPTLTDAFVRAIADTIQIRGVYYAPIGRAAAVAAAVSRLAAPMRQALQQRLDTAWAG